MSAHLRSGYYLGRKSSVCLALVGAALLLALLVLGILYGRCARQLEGAGLRPHPPPCANATGAPAAPALPPGPWDARRLPPHLLPVHYSLLLWPLLAPGLPEPPRAHAGQANITVRCRQATAVALLHADELAFQSAAVWGPLEEGEAPGANGSRRARFIPLAELWLEPSKQYVVLELRENLTAGALYQLRFAFQGTIHGEPDFRGLFLNKYEDEGESRWLIASQLEPVDARTVYPCFDDPAMKATFKIRIVHHPTYIALSNMPAIDVSEYKDMSGLINGTTPINWTVTTFETTPKMSTYITAFVVCKFDHVATSERGNEIRIWASKDAVRKGYTEYALNITGRIFSFMEDLFNISYPLSKTDLIALPKMSATAMENWGLMTFQERSLLYQPQDKGTNKKREISLILAHEIGHQWFGNLVTMEWWNDLWLSEGFASYLEYLGAHYIEPTMSLDQIFSFKIVFPMLRLDDGLWLSQSLSDTHEHRETDGIMELFGFITYRKGASIIRMLSSFTTERLFIKALSSYLNAFSFSNAIQDDLWNHIQKVIDEQNDVQLPAAVKVIMDTWTCQSGFPLLTVNFSTGNISQEKFYIAGVKNNEVKNSTNNTWIIPVSWMKNGTMQPLVWLDKRSKIFPEMVISGSEYDWIILNVNMTGYYKIKYDQTYWRRLATVLENDPKAIPVVNRLQLMEDAFNLEGSGYTSFDNLLYLTKYLEKEDDIVVWGSALNKLQVSDWELILSDYELYPVLKKYFLPRILPIFHRCAHLLHQHFDVELEEDDIVINSMERVIEIACWFRLRDCLDLASQIFTKWMNNPDKGGPACFSRTVCCYGVQLGGDKEWDFLWNIYKQNSTGSEEKYNAYSALSCTHEPWLLQRFLQYTLNDSSTPSYRIAEIIENAARNEIGHWITWKFVTDNWSHLYNRSGFEALTAFVRSVRTDIELQMVQSFLNTTLEPQLRTITGEILKEIKSKKEKRRDSVIKMIQWIKTNTND
ncbi:aminopeptidase Q isoform X1 [Pogona vitticeps]